MNRYTLLLVLVFLSLAALAAAGCGGGRATSPSIGQGESLNVPPKPSANDLKGVSAYNDPDPDWTWDLIAGQNIYAGTVKVWNDGDEFYATYSLFQDALDDGWLICEAHVGFWERGDEPSKGKPGRFQIKWKAADPSEYAGSKELSIALSELDFGEKHLISIATHATICRGADETYEKHTMWGGHWNGEGGEWDFAWLKQWGGGFFTGVMPAYDLPATGYTYRAYHPYGNISYWKAMFSPDGPYPFPGGNPWAGWCTDPRTMYPGTLSSVILYSCYDQNLPSYAQSEHWDLISYLITKRNEGQGIYAPGFHYQDFQDAVWYFKYGSGMRNTSRPKSLEFIADAELNGEGFIPGPGEYFAVILWPLASFQMNIIEVDP